MATFSCRRHDGTLELAGGLTVVWPILPALLFGAILLGVMVTLFEGSSAFDGVYFAFVTSLTIDYGNLVPRRTASRALAVGVISRHRDVGILLITLVAAIAGRAMEGTSSNGRGP